MTTIILGGMVVLCTAAAITLGLRARGYKQIAEELEDDYDMLIDKYTNAFLEVTELKQQVTKLKRKPRKDKGQPRTSYNGKPITNKRKVQEGEQGTDHSKSAK
jgi:hypothetical protein